MNPNRRIYLTAGELNCRKLKDYMEWCRSKQMDSDHAEVVVAGYQKSGTAANKKRQETLRESIISDEKAEKRGNNTRETRRRSTESKHQRRTPQNFHYDIDVFPPTHGYNARKFDDIEVFPMQSCFSMKTTILPKERTIRN
jgi:hypothetical protein